MKESKQKAADHVSLATQQKVLIEWVIEYVVTLVCISEQSCGHS